MFLSYIVCLSNPPLLSNLIIRQPEMISRSQYVWHLVSIYSPEHSLPFQHTYQIYVLTNPSHNKKLTKPANEIGMDGQEGEDESKDQDVAATGRSGKHAVSSVMPKLRTEKIAKVNKTFHRSHTSPGLEANSSGRKKLDWEDRDKVRDMLIGSGKSSNSGKRADGATKSMVITKDENDSLN